MRTALKRFSTWVMTAPADFFARGAILGALLIALGLLPAHHAWRHFAEVTVMVGFYATAIGSLVSLSLIIADAADWLWRLLEQWIGFLLKRLGFG